MPGETTQKLSELLRTKNPDKIIDAMTELVASQAELVEDRIKDAKAGNEDSTLMKDINGMMGNLDKLHKLIKPLTPGGTTVNNNFILPHSQVPDAIRNNDSRQVAALVYKELEQANPGGLITDDMVRDRILQYQKNVIEGEVVRVDNS